MQRAPLGNGQSYSLVADTVNLQRSFFPSHREFETKNRGSWKGCQEAKEGKGSNWRQGGSKLETEAEWSLLPSQE